MKILDTNGKETSQSATIKKYYEQRPKLTLAILMYEVNALHKVAKEELARGAAQDLGWTVVD
jgi:hypothetical protein